jgi:hypothetical protein
MFHGIPRINRIWPLSFMVPSKNILTIIHFLLPFLFGKQITAFFYNNFRKEYYNICRLFYHRKNTTDLASEKYNCSTVRHLSTRENYYVFFCSQKNIFTLVKILLSNFKNCVLVLAYFLGEYTNIYLNNTPSFIISFIQQLYYCLFLC